MSYKKIQTSGLIESPLHEAAKEKGTEHFMSWSNYNVIDRFKSLSNEEIKADLKKNSFPYAVMCENILGDFNIATVIRNANAFGAREFFYVGNKKYDKRGACGTFYYIDVNWISDYKILLDLKEKYSFIGIDNVPGSISMNDYKFEGSKPPMIIFGEEGCGLTPQMLEICDSIVHIEQFGSVRSLNVGTASGVIMNHVATLFNKNRRL